MKGKIKYIIAVLAFIGGTSLQAQTRLTLDSCRSIALANNRQSKSAQMQLQKMDYEVKAYRANFLPRISAQGMYLYTTTDFRYRKRYNLFNTEELQASMNQLPMPDWEKLFFNQVFSKAYVDLDLWVRPSNVFLSGLQFEQPLYMGGKITTAYKMSKTGRQIAQLNVIRSDAETLLKTDRAYWNYVKVQELHHTALKYREAVQSVLNDARNGVETGMVSENDRMKAQVKWGEADLMVREAENGKRLARMNLCMTIGLPLLTPVVPLDTLPDELPVMLPEAVPDVTVRTEYAMLNKQLEMKKQQVNLTRSEFMPQLALGGGYNYINGVRINDTKLFDNASLSAVLTLKIPVTQWIEGSNRVRSAKADFYIAEYQMQESADLLQLEMMKAYNTLDEALLKTAIARDEYAQTQENLRIFNDRYELGLETLSALLEAQALWQQAWSRFIEAKVALRMAESDYARVTNGATE
ncbi:MAG: TolC family protein [Tannerella sp.]|jgi:outer membrane protein TolC|nr:TolC family protein [Tannerella sp.]